MKNFLVLVLIAFCFASCKKAIESVQEDLIVKAMTDGQWRVTKFTRDGVDVTTGFDSYKFQFQSNKTVDAINNGTTETTGTWNGNATDRTIASNFTSANATVSLLNGTWSITRNSWTFVEATQTVNTEVRTLRLDK
ncbi:MAG: hypothetical protein ACXWWD_03815 [Chitinophagaceae bacterium]